MPSLLETPHMQTTQFAVYVSVHHIFTPAQPSRDFCVSSHSLMKNEDANACIYFKGDVSRRIENKIAKTNERKVKWVAR